MNLPTLIDVAIGLALMFALLATLGSVLAELLAAHQKWRHKLLRLTVTRLLEPETARKFWSHSLILPLFDRAPRATPAAKTALPPPAVPAVPAVPAAAPAPVTKPAAAVKPPAAKTDWTGWVKKLFAKTIRPFRVKTAEAPAYLDSTLFASVVLDLAVGQGAAGRVPPTLAAWEFSIRAHIPAKPGENNDLQDRLLALLRQVPSDTTDCGAALKANVAKWYDVAMTRTSGEYRRKLQKALLFIGGALALGLNCDAVRITQVLYQNPAMRAQVAERATALVKAKQEKEQAAATAATAPDPATARETLKQNVQEIRDLVSVDFPIGWTDDRTTNFAFAPPPNSPWSGWIAAVLGKIGGLFASALAVCLGAPFWFDLLGRLVKLRSSAGSDAEKAKSPGGPGGSPDALGAAAGAGGPPPSGPTGGAAAAAPIPLPSLLDALADPRTEFSVARAYWLGMIADKAYEDRPAVEAWFKERGFTLTTDNLANPGTGTEAYLAVGPGVAVLAFRGTEPKVVKDWVTDARVKQKDGAILGLTGQLHTGFTDALGSIRPALDGAIGKLKTQGVLLHVTGHSLGGALATLAAAYIARKQAFPVHSVHTYGSPRVGDAAFVGFFDGEYAGRAYRIVNNEDLVTRVPPRELPMPDKVLHYEHVGAMIYIDANGQIQRDIGYWYRFLNFVTNALENFKQAVETTVRDHSMKLYCGHLEKAARTSAPRNL